MSEQEESGKLFNQVLRVIAIMGVVLLVMLLIVTVALRTQYVITPSVREQSPDARDVLERANDAVNSVSLILSFLEGASVLVGLGFGAATLYGMRSTQETREALRAETARIEDVRKQIDAQISELQQYRPYLENLADLRRELEESRRSLEQTIDNVARLLQADQEFRLKNYDTAYEFAHRVLAQDAENPMALYIAGWLEVQHLRDKLDEGISHLQKVAALEANWPTVRAAYGIGLRRKARTASGEERERLFWQAEGVLMEALARSPRLLDFEGESFWGPIGGIRRELGQIDGAIEAYEKALSITPSSSYPLGALATLYLRKARQAADPTEWLAKALKTFEGTRTAAFGELAQKPNNYYLLMDIAQSSIMLGRQDPANFKQGHDTLAQALMAEVSLNSLETSLRGWHDLLDNCPEDWADVRENLEQAIATMSRAMENKAAA